MILLTQAPTKHFVTLPWSKYSIKNRARALTHVVLKTLPHDGKYGRTLLQYCLISHFQILFLNICLFKQTLRILPNRIQEAPASHYFKGNYSKNTSKFNDFNRLPPTAFYIPKMHRCVAVMAQNKILMALNSIFLPYFSTLLDCSSNYWEHTFIFQQLVPVVFSDYLNTLVCNSYTHQTHSHLFFSRTYSSVFGTT